MQLLQTKRRTSFRRTRILAILGVLAAVGFAGWRAWDPALKRYREWKQQRALEQARDYIAKRDPENAKMALEVALSTSQGDPEVWRAAAQLLESVGSPQAIKLRRRVAQMEPASPTDAAAVVMVALQFGDVNGARDALSAMSPEVARKKPALQAALAFALTVDDKAVADLLLDTLRQQEPNEAQFRLMQGMLHLRHPDAEKRAAAWKDLQELAESDPTKAAVVYREFATRQVLARNYAEAKQWFGKLLALPGATFDDRLQLANVELLVDKKPAAELMPALREGARKDAESAYAFVQWLVVQGKTAEADEFFKSLPEETRNRPAFRTLEGDIVVQLEDWSRLEKIMRAGGLGPIQDETIRLVMVARTLGSSGREALRTETWQAALDSTSRNLAGLAAMRRLANAWKWQKELEATLWTITRNFPDQAWAYQALMSIYRKAGNTSGLLGIISILRQNNADVPRYEHDWALLTILTEPSLTWTSAKEAMKKLYTAEPTLPTYATGYAFALAQVGKAKEAMEVISKLSEADRAYPPRWPYLAYIYGVARERAKWEAVAREGATGNYLPEEKALFELGREALEKRAGAPGAAPAPQGGKT